MVTRDVSLLVIGSLVLAGCAVPAAELNQASIVSSPAIPVTEETLDPPATYDLGSGPGMEPSTDIEKPPVPTQAWFARTYDEARLLFEYASSVPVDVSVVSETERDGVILRDVTYAAYNGQFTSGTEGRISAYLVRPSGGAPCAGVLFLHQLERGQDRKEFLEEAILLAGRGVVSLLPDGVFPWIVRFSGDGAKDQANIVSQVIELRRALDLLLAQPQVDPQRIGYVGHDYGAMHGALLAGVEDRVRAYVLVAGDDNYSDWALQYFVHPADSGEYRSMLAGTDPIAFVSHAAPAALLFQFAMKDRFIPQESATKLFEAASEPRQVKWYDTGHNLDERAQQDRMDWLAQELGLSTSP